MHFSTQLSRCLLKTTFFIYDEKKNYLGTDGGHSKRYKKDTKAFTVFYIYLGTQETADRIWPRFAAWLMWRQMLPTLAKAKLSGQGIFYHFLRPGWQNGSKSGLFPCYPNERDPQRNAKANV